MTLKGMSGSKKLKDIFIDQKIPITESGHMACSDWTERVVLFGFLV